jgi:galactose mutarotase-like enzyme
MLPRMIEQRGDDYVIGADRARFAIRPARGGMVTRFEVGNVPVMYMDDATLADPAKNVRGGNPVLFPSPGKLSGDAWARGSHSGAMSQHGFARNLPWRVLGTIDGASPAIAVELTSTEQTRAQFPWPFSLQMTYSICSDDTLRIDQRVENRGDTPMPFGVGFHPYFRVAQADKPRARIATNATRAFDNVAKRDVDIPPVGIDLTAAEVDLHLLDHKANECELVSATGRVTVRGSAEFTHWVVWTVAGKDFVCVEPWTCPGNALNTGDRLLTLAPNQPRSLWVELSFRTR